MRSIKQKCTQTLHELEGFLILFVVLGNFRVRSMIETIKLKGMYEKYALTVLLSL